MPTLAILKPDLVSCPPLAAQVLQAIRSSRLQVERAALLRIKHEQAAQLYQEHEGRFYYNRLIRLICSGPAIVMELKVRDGQMKSSIVEWRNMIGASKFMHGFGKADANRETFRWKYALSDVRNVAHGADSFKSAQRELAIFNKFMDVIVHADELEKWTWLSRPDAVIGR